MNLNGLLEQVSQALKQQHPKLSRVSGGHKYVIKQYYFYININYCLNLFKNISLVRTKNN
jgi:hypothetical protein